jgi:hypothetical protein
MPTLSRRQILARSAATAACAAMPAAAIGAVETAPIAWSMEICDWTPGKLFRDGDVVRFGDRLHYVMEEVTS